MWRVSLSLTNSYIIPGKLVYCFIYLLHAAHTKNREILLNDVNSHCFFKNSFFCVVQTPCICQSNIVLTFDHKGTEIESEQILLDILCFKKICSKL